MRNTKNSRRIVVNDIEYRWRARGGPLSISVGIWPENNIGTYIQGNLGYHESFKDNGNGTRSSKGDQIVITNRIVKRIIQYVIMHHDYDPMVKSKEINLGVLDNIIQWDDAERAS